MLVRDEAEEEKPKKRAKKKKEPVNQEPHVAVEGPKWMIHPPWLIYKSVKTSSWHHVSIDQACDNKDGMHEVPWTINLLVSTINHSCLSSLHRMQEG